MRQIILNHPVIKHEITRVETIHAEDHIKIKSWYGERRDVGFSINLAKPVAPQVRSFVGNNGLAHELTHAIFRFAEANRLRAVDLIRPAIPIKVVKVAKV